MLYASFLCNIFNIKLQYSVQFLENTYSVLLNSQKFCENTIKVQNIRSKSKSTLQNYL